MVKLKVPKGTDDFYGAKLVLREKIFDAIKGVFKRHGGTPLDTPVFELKEILAGKYGEDSKLIYDLADQGGELCSLRYDLTVPFARFLAMNRDAQQIKRYQVAKVYRRDQPAPGRGRMREFYQCDFDIAGTYDVMIPDAEVLCIIVDVFDALTEELQLEKDVFDIEVKLNHRKILDGMFAVAGVPEDKTRTISSAVDKLDKMPWEEVKKEMVVEKGLAEEVADRIGGYVQRKGTISEMLEVLRADATLSANDSIKAGIADLELLGSYLKAMGVDGKISFDMSLARGLDYYTGLIYEVVTKQPPPPPGKSGKKDKDDAGQVGSIAAGGRYDNLVGMYVKTPIPCVGISFGVERIFALIMARQDKAAAQGLGKEIDVYVMSSDDDKTSTGLLPERMEVARQLWKAGFRTEFAHKVSPSKRQQEKPSKAASLVVYLAKEELADGKVRVKSNFGKGSGSDDKKDKEFGPLVSRVDLAGEVKRLLSRGAGIEGALDAVKLS